MCVYLYVCAHVGNRSKDEIYRTVPYEARPSHITAC